jgi:centromeric protein E
VRDIEQDENHSGLIPRCINLVFDKLIVKRRKHIKVYCSFIQLYNENMLDLLQDDDKVAKEQKLVIHENKQDGIYVEGLTEEQVETVEDCLEYMKKGEKNRVVRHTHMNIKSSRSHTVFQLLIEEVFPAKKTYRVHLSPFSESKLTYVI